MGWAWGGPGFGLGRGWMLAGFLLVWEGLGPAPVGFAANSRRGQNATQGVIGGWRGGGQQRTILAVVALSPRALRKARSFHVQ